MRKIDRYNNKDRMLGDVEGFDKEFQTRQNGVFDAIDDFNAAKVVE